MKFEQFEICIRCDIKCKPTYWCKNCKFSLFQFYSSSGNCVGYFFDTLKYSISCHYSSRITFVYSRPIVVHRDSKTLNIILDPKTQDADIDKLLILA